MEIARYILAATGLKAGADYADIRVTTGAPLSHECTLTLCSPPPSRWSLLLTLLYCLVISDRRLLRSLADIDPATGQTLKDGKPVVDGDGKPVMYDTAGKDVRAMSSLGAKGEPGLLDVNLGRVPLLVSSHGGKQATRRSPHRSSISGDVSERDGACGCSRRARPRDQLLP